MLAITSMVNNPALCAVNVEIYLIANSQNCEERLLAFSCLSVCLFVCLCICPSLHDAALAPKILKIVGQLKTHKIEKNSIFYKNENFRLHSTKNII